MTALEMLNALVRSQHAVYHKPTQTIRLVVNNVTRPILLLLGEESAGGGYTIGSLERLHEREGTTVVFDIDRERKHIGVRAL